MSDRTGPMTGWTPPPPPRPQVFEGRYARLEPLDADCHAALLFREFAGHDGLWTYMWHGPFASAAQYHRWARENAGLDDPMFFAIQSRDSGIWGGVAAFMRIAPDSGVIELGSITLAPSLARSRAATEAFFLMMAWAFQAGYRRFEWKCDAGNTASRRAAQRLGFSFEGIFRQHMIVKGRNRDTAWFAVTDGDWPALKEAFQVWLAPGNFDIEGQQIESLSDLTRLVRVSSDPGVGPR